MLWIGICVGVVTLAYGLISQFVLESAGDSSDMLNGMFSGFGAVLIVMGLIALIRDRLISDEKRVLEENRMNDERNHQILGKACVVSTVASVLCLGVMAFLFVALGYPVPSYISVGGMYVILITLLISTRLYAKKM